ncbi:helix-turn-helix domain-containing protein [Flavobacteriaceae bacterium R38]|nr:helix-turn-helix domain-containing protein [Flavobacteriaceae bacterium R38]
MEVFFFIGIVICAFLVLLIFNKKKRSESDRIFGIWQIILTIHFSLLYIRHSELIQEYPHFIGLDTSLVLLHVPFIFFYTRSIVGTGLKKSQLIIHLLPFVLMSLTLMITLFFISGDEKLTLYNRQLSGQKLFSITDIILFIQCFIYIPLSYRIVRRHSELVKANYSNIEKRNLSWLEMILIGASIVFGLIFLLHLFYLISNDIDFQVVSKISILSICLFQLILGYFGIRYTPIFSEIEENTIRDSPKYEKTGLSKATAKKYFSALEEYMKMNKPYLDAELTLKNLAEQLKISSNHLSQVINQFTNKNFYTYVNEYRIEEVSRLLTDINQQQYSILGLAYDAGFKSKSVFNALFKKIKGITPSEYRKTNIQ